MERHDDIAYQDIASGEHDEELGRMARTPENADLTVSEIKDKLCHKILDNMAVEVEFDPIVEQIGACGFVLFLLLLSIEYLITPR